MFLFKKNSSNKTQLSSSVRTSAKTGAGSLISQSKSLFKGVHLPLLLSICALLLYGLVVIYSAGLSIPEASFKRQFFGVILGATLAFICWNFDFKKLAHMTTLLLIIDVVLMLLPLMPGLGYHAKGINGWIQIPFIHLRFQPAEPAKIVTLLLMASLVSQYNSKVDKLSVYIKLCAILAVPFVLILAQPDLGTGLIILVSGATVIALGGAPKKWVFITIAAIVILVALVLITDPVIDRTWGDSKSLLKDYQMARLTVFLDPNIDPGNLGYNLQQSKIAVGSGGFFGKGIGNTTQSTDGFLPEAHTDFVFALLAEEFGFVGATLLLLLFAALIASAIHIALRSGDYFSSLLIVGICSMWAFQILQNIGMCIGIMPITGIPLPFISFGSSSMLAQLMAVGIVASLWKHRGAETAIQS